MVSTTSKPPRFARPVNLKPHCFPTWQRGAPRGGISTKPRGGAPRNHHRVGYTGQHGGKSCLINTTLLVLVEHLNAIIEAAINRVSAEQHPPPKHADNLCSAALVLAMMFMLIEDGYLLYVIVLKSIKMFIWLEGNVYRFTKQNHPNGWIIFGIFFPTAVKC